MRVQREKLALVRKKPEATKFPFEEKRGVCVCGGKYRSPTK